MTARAYHIAFEHGIDLRILMEIAQRAGVSLKSHMSPLGADEESALRGAVDRVKEGLLSEPEAAVSPTKPAAPVPAAPLETAPTPEETGEALVTGGLVVPAPPKPEKAPRDEAAPVGAAAGRQPPTLDDRIKQKAPPARKKKRIREDAKPMDSAEILEELKGRFISSGMKGIIGPGRRPVRPRAGRPRRPVRSHRRGAKSPAVPAQLGRELEITLPITVKDLS
ncbi:MAG: hypothetical protein ACYS47_19295, partial [Planctomycetota bacterium]